MKPQTVVLSTALCAALAVAACVTAFLYANAQTNRKRWKQAEEHLKVKAEELTALHATLISSSQAASNALEQLRLQHVETMTKASNAVPRLNANSEMTQMSKILLQAEPARQLPITVARRYAIPGGYVLQIKNNSPDSIVVRAELVNDTFRHSKTFDVVIDGAATKEIGKLDGWTTAAGDKIRLSSAGYEPLMKQF